VAAIINALSSFDEIEGNLTLNMSLMLHKLAQNPAPLFSISLRT